MRDLVRDRRAADMVRRHHQPPAVAEVAGRGAAAPATARIADADAADREFGQRRDLPAFAPHQVERLPFQPAFDAATDGLGRPAEAQGIPVQPDGARRRWRPVDMPLNPEDRHRSTRADEHRQRRLADLFGQPVLLFACPAQGPRDVGAARQGEAQFAARCVENEPVAPGARVDDQPHRPGRPVDHDMRPIGRQVRRRVRQDGSPAVRRYPRRPSSRDRLASPVDRVAVAADEIMPFGQRPPSARRR